jgi:hypothetical protein
VADHPFEVVSDHAEAAIIATSPEREEKGTWLKIDRGADGLDSLPSYCS